LRKIIGDSLSTNNLIATDLDGGLYVDLADNERSFQPKESQLSTCQATGTNLNSTKILKAGIHIRSLQEALAGWTL